MRLNGVKNMQKYVYIFLIGFRLHSKAALCGIDAPQSVYMNAIYV